MKCTRITLRVSDKAASAVSPLCAAAEISPCFQETPQQPDVPSRRSPHHHPKGTFLQPVRRRRSKQRRGHGMLNRCNADHPLSRCCSPVRYHIQDAGWDVGAARNCRSQAPVSSVAPWPPCNMPLLAGLGIRKWAPLQDEFRPGLVPWPNRDTCRGWSCGLSCRRSRRKSYALLDSTLCLPAAGFVS